MMLIFWTFVLGAVCGYLYGFYLRPNQRLRKAIREARKTVEAALAEGNKGVYRTLVTEQNQTSELTVEVKELALTQAGQVKVQYISAFYKNPAFRSRKGEALLKEVRDLLGDYLPYHEIEWYENGPRQTYLKEQLQHLDQKHHQQFGA